MRDYLDKYLEQRRRARKEFWLMVAVSAAVLFGAAWSLGRLV